MTCPRSESQERVEVTWIPWQSCHLPRKKRAVLTSAAHLSFVGPSKGLFCLSPADSHCVSDEFLGGFGDRLWEVQEPLPQPDSRS